jgi:hypothetical protein
LIFKRELRTALALREKLVVEAALDIQDAPAVPFYPTPALDWFRKLKAAHLGAAVSGHLEQELTGTMRATRCETCPSSHRP